LNRGWDKNSVPYNFLTTVIDVIWWKLNVGINTTKTDLMITVKKSASVHDWSRKKAGRDWNDVQTKRVSSWPPQGQLGHMLVFWCLYHHEKGEGETE
jgi:hypothetical protein